MSVGWFYSLIFWFFRCCLCSVSLHSITRFIEWFIFFDPHGNCTIMQVLTQDNLRLQIIRYDLLLYKSKFYLQILDNILMHSISNILKVVTRTILRLKLSQESYHPHYDTIRGNGYGNGNLLFFPWVFYFNSANIKKYEISMLMVPIDPFPPPILSYQAMEIVMIINKVCWNVY